MPPTCRTPLGTIFGPPRIQSLAGGVGSSQPEGAALAAALAAEPEEPAEQAVTAEPAKLAESAKPATPTEPASSAEQAEPGALRRGPGR